MEPETLVLNLGSQAAAALLVLTAIRCELPTTAGARSPARPDVGRSTSEQFWSGMKQRWLPTDTREGK